MIDGDQRNALKDYLLSGDGDLIEQAEELLANFGSEQQERETQQQKPRNATGNLNQLASYKLTEIIDAVEAHYRGWHCGLQSVEHVGLSVYSVLCSVTNAQTPRNAPPVKQQIVLQYDFETGDLV